MMTILRREFLGTLGAVSVAATLDVAHAAAESSPLAADRWDVSWTDKVKRKHRAVFDSPGFSEGAALFRAVIWKRQYKAVYGTAPTDMNAVIVVRHSGIWLAMNDAFWKKYKVGEAQKFKDDDTGAFYEINPIASPSSEAPPEFADMTMPKFLASGDIVLGCHLAFREVIALVKKVDALATDEEAEKRAMTFVIPGVIMQPSGVFATLRAQEAGCHYILAS